jgi:hypothetical protein
MISGTLLTFYVNKTKIILMTLNKYATNSDNGQ